MIANDVVFWKWSEQPLPRLFALRLKMEKTRAKLHHTLQDVGHDQQHPDIQKLSAEFDRLHNEYLAYQEGKRKEPDS
ncbi:MAG: hypothetical protein QM451_08665 [Bacillota bacterium]|jgi:hypothetical protein|nr:hypothetical protein [Bacillota bacterium]HHT91850.1 hypothetical protein [Bacillota bacterium]